MIRNPQWTVPAIGSVERVLQLSRNLALERREILPARRTVRRVEDVRFTLGTSNLASVKLCGNNTTDPVGERTDTI